MVEIYSRVAHGISRFEGYGSGGRHVRKVARGEFAGTENGKRGMNALGTARIGERAKQAAANSVVLGYMIISAKSCRAIELTNLPMC